jgi:hypothetical protein
MADLPSDDGNAARAEAEVVAEADVVQAWRALGLDPPPEDLALALPAALQVRGMARDVHELLSRRDDDATRGA